MRCVTGMLLVVIAAAGCRNQPATTFSNPFLKPDRVPPPSTRPLAPGAALPYYPGDPVPGAAAASPTTTLPSSATYSPSGGLPPANAYPTQPGTVGYPASGNVGGAVMQPPAGNPIAWPTATPPGGWPPTSSTGPSSASGVKGDEIRIPDDTLQYQFGGSSQTTYAAPSSVAAAPSIDAMASAPRPQVRMPIQSILPLDSERAAASQLAAREVTPAEYLAGIAQPEISRASSATLTASRDGFRPQGSRNGAAASSQQPFQPPQLGRTSTEISEESTRFAADANYQWLRGQLEYWAATGQWTLRYLPAGATADSLGGRVLIENPQVLANLQPGELVIVRGQLHQSTANGGGVEPAYRVAAVQRQQQ